MTGTTSSIFLTQKWAAVYADTIGYTYKLQFPAVTTIDIFKGDMLQCYMVCAIEF